MNSIQHHSSFKFLFAGTILIGLPTYLAWKYYKRMKKSQSRVLNIDPSSVHLVCTASGWERIYSRFKQEIEVLKVVGLDCEWVALYRSHRPVSLLQLATPSGLCVLIRMMHLDSIPDSLIQLLENKSVLKVGVEVVGDARRLHAEYGINVRGCIDLRYVASRAHLDLAGSKSLKGLTEKMLGVELDKNIMVRASNWEAFHLAQVQMEYAARDALVGVLIFEAMVCQKFHLPYPFSCTDLENTCPWLMADRSFWRKVESMCQGLADVSYKDHTPNNKKSLPKSATSHPKGEVEGFEQRAERAFHGRQSPLYHNSQLLAPDGQVLCTLSTKKALWYLEKGLGVKIQENPVIVRLNFEPSGRPTCDKNYYLQDKFNMCVVCGREDSYLRKNIVPHEYRKFFPGVMKEHRSHDVLLMCSSCHARSGTFESTIKSELAQRCNAPVDTQKYRQDYDLFKIKSAAKALLRSGSQLPPARHQELSQIIKDFYGLDEPSDKLLEEARDMDVKCKNTSFSPHGRQVIQYVSSHEGLVEFECMWRQQFIQNMQPKFLPKLWSVDHGRSELDSMDKAMKAAVAAPGQTDT